MKKNVLLLTIPVMMAAPLPAQVAVEDFEGYTVGEGLTTPLSGGSGWNGAWVTANATTASGVVADSVPLGSGKYLAVNLQNTAGGQAMGIGRELSGGAPTGSYTVSFDWRVDALGSFTTSNDRFEFYSSNSAATVNGAGPGGNTSTSPYLMGVFGAARGANYTTGGIFGVYASPTVGGGFAGDNYYNLGSLATGGDGTTLSLTENTTYSFTIDVHDDQTWDVSVTNGSTTAFSSGLSWWGSNTQPFLGFGARGDTASELRSFSIDNVAVVPEPSAALLGLGSLGLLLRRRR